MSNNLIRIFLNSTEQGLSKNFIDDTDTDFLKGNLSVNSQVVGTGVGANVTLRFSEIAPNGSTVLLMHFNNDTGTGENASLFLNNATFQNGTGIGNGSCNRDPNLGFCPIFNESNARLGKASAEFNGSRYINFTDRPSFRPQSHTIEAWVKYNKIAVACVVCKAYGTGGDDSYALVTDTTRVMAAYVSTTAGTKYLTGGSIFLNQWHHVMCVKSSEGVYMFVDGSLAASDTAVSAPISAAATKTFIGKIKSNSNLSASMWPP